MTEFISIRGARENNRKDASDWALALRMVRRGGNDNDEQCSKKSKLSHHREDRCQTSGSAFASLQSLSDKERRLVGVGVGSGDLGALGVGKD